MTPEPSSAEPSDLAARAAEKHVVVIGGGIGGLVAARECAKVGMRVTLLEAADDLGGAIRKVELDGVTIDAGAESYATRGGLVRALVEELGLADRIVTPQAGGAWLAGIPGVGAAPLPVGGILGIPANPFQDDVRRIIGWSGVWRAYLDRVRPPLTIGHQLSLGKLVGSRMGAKVRDRLVAPVTTGVYSASPDDVDIDVAAPGLNAALTRVGSLSGAVQALRDDAAAKATGSSVTGPSTAAKAPGAAVEGLSGGMSVLVDALAADLVSLGAEVRTGVRVRSVRKSATTWSVETEVAPAGDILASADDDTDALAAELHAAEIAAAEPVLEDITADAVIIATSESAARDLLATAVPALTTTEAASSPEIEIVTLLLDAPELEVAPRGTGVLTVPGSHTAKALTHSTAKWSWVRDAAGARQVVRVSFGAQGEPAATAELSDEAAADLARREAAALLGVAIAPEAVIASHRGRFVQSQPASIIGSAERRAAARAAVTAVPGVAAVGAWLAGTGLAQVIPDARDEADRLRRALLWE
ncbi:MULTISPECIES: NAD(P)/FAD-dependent oxidoreductase [unclassified Microbacterium]|uniref:protoporphyrinogen/coproporphyrinogen oxidase n=1 Tax=unclassified Microbacterium TaxID=2609290 RepID=UPI000CFB5217|nr:MULTISPECIES: FAD-dependent oxidoreductase [unclassified Microbacterium]PQZ54817.1 protoporphyrinogen oxidase [Microbacterium sp. MYb43]PQZ77493.1 protoporphyrinogen oxidase [Microbacterium sp. MYb40]PRB19761.1 protoporphyrinogen oxidase [Microbacterium sp. MYb54]PRB25868.1 protoporphyrinogen oxidase [Microbacterium sp. MYb50]PRB64362.1 protoporphyrinogen oxidase [Microbacterium sp. MYb24]